MNPTALSFAAAAALFISLPAAAQSYPQPPPGQPAESCDHERQHPGYEHTAWVANGGQYDRDGRNRRDGYELRTVQKWVEGYYQQVWVPGQCFGLHVQVCRPGSYQQQWVPGRYVSAQEWVYVDRNFHHGPRHGERHGRRW